MTSPSDRRYADLTNWLSASGYILPDTSSSANDRRFPSRQYYTPPVWSSHSPLIPGSHSAVPTQNSQENVNQSANPRMNDIAQVYNTGSFSISDQVAYNMRYPGGPVMPLNTTTPSSVPDFGRPQAKPTILISAGLTETAYSTPDGKTYIRKGCTPAWVLDKGRLGVDLSQECSNALGEVMSGISRIMPMFTCSLEDLPEHAIGTFSRAARRTLDEYGYSEMEVRRIAWDEMLRW